MAVAGPQDGTQWCFVHAADLHLDTGFEGIGQVDERLAQRLRDASLDAFDALVDLTLAQDAAFLVLAGDVYDGAERGLRAQLRFERGVRRLADVGIPTFVAHGNHDPLVTGWQLVTDWPDEVHVFGHEGVTSHVVADPDGRARAVVQGVSYAEQAEQRNLARLFHRTDDDVLHVGVLHTNVGEVGAHANYAPCSVADLRGRGIDYWALGHIHERQVVLDGTGTDPWAVYPGNLQGRTPRWTERGEKGASVVRVEHGRVRRVDHVPLDRARFVDIELDVTDLDTVGDVQRELATRARRAVAEADGRILVLRAVLRGRSDVHHVLARPGAVSDLRDDLRDGLRSADAAWTAVKDRTAPPVDEAALAAVVEVLDATDLDEVAVTRHALSTMVDQDWPVDDLDAATLATAGRGLAVSLLAGGDA